MKIFIISDTHFAHQNMYGFLTQDGKRVRSRWDLASEADAYMIEMWNQTVTPQDHVYHLGDFTMMRSQPWINLEPLVRKLNGHKRLILGNHDHFDVRVYRDAGFQKVMASNRLGGVLLTHYPVHPSCIEGLRWKGNAHGHIHERQSPPGRYFNASVEQINYTPIDLDEIVAVLDDKDEAIELEALTPEIAEASAKMVNHQDFYGR